MIHEYAVDPLVASGWERLQRLLSQFGFSNGRLIGRIPGKWRKAVLDSLPDTCGELERSKIAQRLRDFEESAFIPHVHEWDAAASWLDNVKAVDTREEFRLILSAFNVGHDDRVVSYDELDEADPPEGWEPDDGDVERQPGAMAGRLRLILQTAKRYIVFVEPNFHPATPRFKEAFRAYFDRICQSPCLKPTTRLELHVSARFERESYEQQLKEHMAAVIPNHHRLTVVCWPDHLLHNRYLLTEKAGVSMGHGLDRNDKGMQGVTHDTFILMPRKSYERQLAKYRIEESVFGVCPKVIEIESIAT